MRFRCTSALSGAVLALATAIGFSPASADIVTVKVTKFAHIKSDEGGVP
jgi:hypothetical protein